MRRVSASGGVTAPAGGVSVNASEREPAYEAALREALAQPVVIPEGRRIEYLRTSLPHEPLRFRKEDYRWPPPGWTEKINAVRAQIAAEGVTVVRLPLAMDGKFHLIPYDPSKPFEYARRSSLRGVAGKGGRKAPASGAGWGRRPPTVAHTEGRVFRTSTRPAVETAPRYSAPAMARPAGVDATAPPAAPPPAWGAAGTVAPPASSAIRYAPTRFEHVRAVGGTPPATFVFGARPDLGPGALAPGPVAVRPQPGPPSFATGSVATGPSTPTFAALSAAPSVNSAGSEASAALLATGAPPAAVEGGGEWWRQALGAQPIAPAATPAATPAAPVAPSVERAAPRFIQRAAPAPPVLSAASAPSAPLAAHHAVQPSPSPHITRVIRGATPLRIRNYLHSDAPAAADRTDPGKLRLKTTAAAASPALSPMRASERSEFSHFSFLSSVPRDQVPSATDLHDETTRDADEDGDDESRFSRSTCSLTTSSDEEGDSRPVLPIAARAASLERGSARPAPSVPRLNLAPSAKESYRDGDQPLTPDSDRSSSDASTSGSSEASSQRESRAPHSGTVTTGAADDANGTSDLSSETGDSDTVSARNSPGRTTASSGCDRSTDDGASSDSSSESIERRPRGGMLVTAGAAEPATTPAATAGAVSGVSPGARM